MTNTADRSAVIAKFMHMLQTRDEKEPLPAIEAANLFPMIADDGEAARLTLLGQSIEPEFDTESDLPRLTLRHKVIITKNGEIVDGRNRTMAILAKFGRPQANWADIAQDGYEEMGVVMRGDAFRAAAVGSDWLARHLEVVDKHDDDLFEDVIAHNMARRDLTSSQRAAVAAQITSDSAKKTKGTRFNVSTGAQAFGVSEKSVKRARFVLKHSPSLFADVLSGKESVGNAEVRVQAMLAKDAKSPGAAAPKPEIERPEAAVVKAKVSITMEAVAEGIAKADDVAALYQAIIDGLDAREQSIPAKAFDHLQTALATALGLNLA